MDGEEILAIAIIRPFEGREAELLEVLRNFYIVLAQKGYSRDQLFREAAFSPRYFNFRYWKSAEERTAAYHDSDIHHFWHKLSEICEVEKIYEELHEVTFGNGAAV
ncbi:MAG: antibiotic biosynthesis monooxygenase [Terriglobales bacterium]